MGNRNIFDVGNDPFDLDLFQENRVDSYNEMVNELSESISLDEKRLSDSTEEEHFIDRSKTGNPMQPRVKIDRKRGTWKDYSKKPKNLRNKRNDKEVEDKREFYDKDMSPEWAKAFNDLINNSTKNPGGNSGYDCKALISNEKKRWGKVYGPDGKLL